ncbi:CTNND2 [Mytilus coruscus]|uniref:CTNND2 n=1 Tax=Mytilus coruscus TaxID=42192 RepID=A0A6J8A6J9_MYTCO|nr:CTNND2 [Mytilus coruscus]
MPAGHYDPQTSYNGDDSAASILKTVQAQEAEFERLTRKLEAERETVGHKFGEYRVGSQSDSMNSINSADDSYWRSPHSDSRLHDDTVGDSKMSSHLLDSCLRELDSRGTFGDNNMDYMEDPYSGGGRQLYNDSYNQGYDPQYMDQRSPHASHTSLQSNDRNRMVQRENHPNDNYTSYSSLARQPGYDDMRGSPGTPTRDMGQPTEQESYGGPPNDRYGDVSAFSEHPPNNPHNDSHVSDSFYRDSPVGERYNVHKGIPQNDPYHDEGYGAPSQERYNEHPYGSDPRGLDGYRDDNRYMDQYGQPQDDRYMPTEDRLADLSLDNPRIPHDGHGPEGYRGHDGPLNDSYGDQPQEQTFGDYDECPYRPEVKHHGLPIVHQDPFADDPFQSKENLANRDHFDGPGNDRYRDDDRYRDEDPYRRDPPSDEDDPYRRGPPVEDFGREPPVNNPYLGRGPQDEEEDSFIGRGPPGDDRYRDEDPYSGRPRPEDNPYGSRHLQDEDPYSGRLADRQPSPTNDGYGGPPPGYVDRYSDEDPVNQQPMFDDRMERSNEGLNMAPPPQENYSDGRRTPSDRGRYNENDAPDLLTVIDSLSHPDDNVKANAAAYLQHICFHNEDNKAKTRGMNGIPPLVELLRNDYPEVQKNALGALKNMSYGGKTENKKAIENAGGITALIRLLRKTQENEVRELVTGILWNLSSCEDLKEKIIQEGLADIVSRIIVPYSGWEKRGTMDEQTTDSFLTTVYRNATGIIRNLSSAGKNDERTDKGYNVRTRLRECSKLVNCLIYTLDISLRFHDKENKPVENCTCALRNLSYRIQEVSEKDFYKKRTQTLKRMQKPPNKKESPGCFGGGNKKKQQSSKNNAKQKPDVNQNGIPALPQNATEYQGLWNAHVIKLYLGILENGSNPVTVEAAAGAIQNLTACFWSYAEDVRAWVRKEKGLPFFVDLLTQDRDSIVCHVALALRNLAIDEKNKTLIGTYAMKQLVSRLPQEKSADVVSDPTVSAILVTLLEIVTCDENFAKTLVEANGLPRIKFVKFVNGKYSRKTKENAKKLLDSMWEFKSLTPVYAMQGITESDVKAGCAPGREPDRIGITSTTPYNTLGRPQGSQGYDDNTISAGRLPAYKSNMNGRMDGTMVHGHSNPAMNMEPERYQHGGSRQRGMDEIPMTDLGPSYAPIEEQHNRRNKPPVGGVPLFPNLQPASPQDYPPHQQDRLEPQSGHEPLYAQVKKGHKRPEDDIVSPNNVMLESGGGGPPGGADSWV